MVGLGCEFMELGAAEKLRIAKHPEEEEEKKSGSGFSVPGSPP